MALYTPPAAYLPGGVLWTRASVGVVGGIPSYTQNGTTIASGSSFTTINNAIQACPVGKFVKLGAGAFSMGGSIVMKSGVALIGSNPAVSTGFTGSDTVLTFTASNNGCIQFFGPYIDPGTIILNITSGLGQGSTVITCSSSPVTAGFAVGDLCIIDQLNDASIPVSSIDETSQPVPFSSRAAGSRCEGQNITIVAISGNTITIDHPIAMTNYTTSLTAQIVQVGNTSSIVHDAGVENLTITQSPTSTGVDQDNIYFQGCYNCWVRNIHSQFPRSLHVHLLITSRIEVRHSTFEFQSGANPYQSSSYGVQVSDAAYSLIEDNIFHSVTTPLLSYGGGNCGNVLAYNYTIDNRYDVSPFWQIESLGCHASHPHMNLYEGNHATSTYWDNIHGSCSHLTTFRNRLFGHGINICLVSGVLTPTLTNTSTSCCVAENNSTHMVYVGNVLGQSGYHTQYLDNGLGGTPVQANIFAFGYGGTDRSTLVGGHSPDSNWKAASFSTSILKGNWNAVNNGINAAESLAGLTLAPSWFYSSQPTWWPTSLPWPWVDVSNPTVDPLVSLPAGYRWNNNAEAPSSTATAPGTPTGPVAAPQSTTSILVTWTAPTESGSQAPANTLIYNLRYSPSLSAVGSTSTPGSTSFLDSGLTPNTTYGYQIQSVDPASGLTSLFSTTASGTTQLANTTPNTPVISTVDSATSTTLTVTWPDTTDTGYPATSLTYNLQRSLTQAGTYTTVSGGSAIPGTGTGLTFTNTGLSPVTTYWYHVSATNPFPHTSAFSTAKSGITTVTAPSFIQANTITAASVNNAQVSFTSSQTSGNTNLIVISTSSASALTIPAGGVVDQAGNVYTLVAGPTTIGTITQWIYAAPI